MREELLAVIEKNSRIDLKELAVILGFEEIDVVKRGRNAKVFSHPKNTDILTY